MRTDFVHWYPLREAERHAPQEPGVFQIRIVEGLLDYPGGKSAMVHYGSGLNLSAEILMVARVHSGGDFLCRHQRSAEPAVLLEFVLTQFQRRFGIEPRWPQA